MIQAVTTAPPITCQRCKHKHPGQDCPAPTPEDRDKLLRDIARFHGTPEQFRVRARWILEAKA